MKNTKTNHKKNSKLVPQYRQGDVFIEKISPNSTKRKNIKNRDGRNRVILAVGEATGHHHAIASDETDLYETETIGVTELEVREAMAALTHEEHDLIEIPKGNYKVVIQKEYAPDKIRKVLD